MLIHLPTPAMTAITATSRMAKSTVYSISEAPFSSDANRLRNLIIEDIAALLLTVLIEKPKVISANKNACREFGAGHAEIQGSLKVICGTSGHQGNLCQSYCSNVFVQKLILARRSRMNYNVGFSGHEVTRVGVCHVASDLSQIRTLDVGCRSRSSLFEPHLQPKDAFLKIRRKFVRRATPMRSRDFWKILHVACAAIIVAAALDFGASAPAHASTFQFNGQCVTAPGNCTGTGRG